MPRYGRDPGSRRQTQARSARVRLDQLLVERGLVETRSRAQALVLAGKVRVGDGDGARLDHKPGDALDPATAIEVAQPEPYVSRGGHKLAAALDAFEIDPTGLDRPGRGRLDGWLHGRAAPARRTARLRARRRSWPARRAASSRRAGHLDGANERTDPDRRDAPRADRPRRRRRVLHLARQGARRPS